MTVAAVTARVQGRGAASSVRLLGPLTEWEEATFDGVRLSPNDRALVKRLGDAGQGRLQIDELVSGLRVRARSWVGVVRLETVEIRVVPKLAGDQLGLIRLLEFTAGLDGLWRFETEAALQVEGESLLDLVALLFAEATERVLRHGVMAGYVEREEDLRVVRGRILADRQVLERFGQIDRLICRFDELEHDVDENRLLVAALRAATRRVKTLSVRRKLERLRSILEPVCDPRELDLRKMRQGLIYNRLNAHYQPAHALAWLVLDSLGVEDLLAPGPTNSFAFLLDMNILFERFVARLIEAAVDPARHRVDAQVSHSSIIWNASAEKPYARVIPDLLVQERGPEGARLAIDAKYKLYDDRKVASNDIYQTFLYAYALSTTTTAATPAAILIYPASAPALQTLELEINSLNAGRGAQIVAVGVPIPAALKELRSGEPGPLLIGLQELLEACMTGDGPRDP